MAMNFFNGITGIFKGGPAGAGPNGGVAPAPALSATGLGPAPLTLLSHKRKSSNSMHHAGGDEVTQEYSALQHKHKLLPATALMLAAKKAASNPVITAPGLRHSVHMQAPVAAAAAAAAASTTVAPIAITITSPSDESPPKKQKLSDGSSSSAAAAAAAAAVPLQPMPMAVQLLVERFEVELESRTERLRSQTELMVSSLQRSFKNELNKIPSKVRALSLREFLDASRYAGDAALVMNEAAMTQQSRLENWVAATPKLRSSRKHRDMILATPSHNTLMATNQRLTRASARKLHPGAVTGLGVGLGEEGPAASELAMPMEIDAPRPVTAPVRGNAPLGEHVFETPSARGRIRQRLPGAAAAGAAAAAAPAPTGFQHLSISALLLSNKKKAAAAAARAASPAPPAPATPATTHAHVPAGSPLAAAAAPQPQQAQQSHDEPDTESENIAPPVVVAAPKGKKGATARGKKAATLEKPVAEPKPKKSTSSASSSTKKKAPSPRVTRARARAAQ